jgi:hypothetical protein
MLYLRLLTRAAEQGYSTGRTVLGSFASKAGRVFLAERAVSLYLCLVVYSIVNDIARVNRCVNVSEPFKRATDRLIGTVSLADLAEELGVSHGLLRQARLSTSASSYRSPPQGWEKAVAKLARERGGALIELADDMEAQA